MKSIIICYNFIFALGIVAIVKSAQNGDIRHVRLQYLSLLSNESLLKTKLTRGSHTLFSSWVIKVFMCICVRQ